MEYTIIRYPDNQISVKLIEFTPTFTFKIASYEDLFVLASIVEICKNYGDKIKSITIPCMFGQRSDLRFSAGQSYDFKVICDFLNALEIPNIKILDPHSPAALIGLKGAEIVESFEYVKKSLAEIGYLNTVLVSPDAGAYKKVFKYSEKLSLPVVAANKFRDLEGHITLSILGDVKDKVCLIVDDLLDGGYTFHLLGQKLKEQGAKKVYLYVSHAYFNKGIDFTSYVDHFYCTDSVREINDKKVTQFKI